MKKAATAEEKNIINVIDEFDYSTQNEGYNESFRKWRRTKNNPYAYNFEMNKKESVFIDGKGFENRSAAEAETNTITRIMETIGLAMLMWLVTDLFLSKALIQLLDLIGIDVHSTFFSDGIYGGNIEIVATIIATSLMKVCIPAVYLHKMLKMPRKLEFMGTLNRSTEMIKAIAFSLTVSTVICLPSIYSLKTREIYTFFKSIDTDVSVWGQGEFVAYIIFDIIILSILTEALFRGAMFGALRQFGDLFAVIISSVVTGLLTQDLYDMVATILISAVAAIGMLRSGTIVTAFFVRILYKMYRFALVIIEVDNSDDMFQKKYTFVLAVFLIGTAMAAATFLIERKKPKLGFAAYHSEVTLGKRIANAVKAFPLPAVVAVCLLSAIIKLVF